MRRFIAIVIFTFMTAAGICEWNWEYDMWIDYLSKKYDIEIPLIMGLIKAESGFKNYAVSSKGAVGFMQLMPETAKSLGVKDIYDPVENLKYGVKYLSILLNRYKNVPLALAAYNAGPGAVAKYGSIPPYPETVNFVFKVMRFSDIYRRQLADGSIKFSIQHNGE